MGCASKPKHLRWFLEGRLDLSDQTSPPQLRVVLALLSLAAVAAGGLRAGGDATHVLQEAGDLPVPGRGRGALRRVAL